MLLQEPLLLADTKALALVNVLQTALSLIISIIYSHLLNPLERSGVRWLHFEVFSAI